MHQSEPKPPHSMPSVPPINAAKLRLPTLDMLKLYGGSLKRDDWVTVIRESHMI